MDRKISVDRIQIGMFVAKLDRPWLDTPFLLQGFLIESREDILVLQKHCRYVYVDPLRSAEIYQDLNGYIEEVEVDRSPRASTDDIVAPEWYLEEYVNEIAFEDELPRAKELYLQAEEILGKFFHDLGKGARPALSQVNDLVHSMTESVIRNPDALMLLARIRRKSEYAYSHAMNVSICSLAFGRHLGYPSPSLQQLGLGGLMLDVGKVRVSEKLLSRPGKLSEKEYESVKRHVEYGIALLEGNVEITRLAFDMIAYHHEREDGSGYPDALRGSAIPVSAKMAAIADCFDALTSERPYARSYSPFEALQILFDWGRQTLHTDLVEQFIQCLGIYPVGGLVELNSGEIGLVIGHNRTRRLKPRVLLLLDHEKQPYRNPITLDLLTAPKLNADIPYAISRALEDGMFGINPQDYYL